VLQLNPSYPSGFQAQAFAPSAKTSCPRRRSLSKARKNQSFRRGHWFCGLGFYEGRFSDAVDLLRKGADADAAARKPDAAADKFALLAYVQLLSHKNGPAIEAAKNALDLSKAVKTRFVLPRFSPQAGETAKAQELAMG